jgi:hypothetical protein
MSTALLISPPAAIAPLGATVLRSMRIEFRPIRDGRELVSPDGRFVARATSTYGPAFLAGSKNYYEFAVEDRRARQLQHIKIPVRRNDLINWRLEGSIAWADDSSAVTFEFNRTCLTILIDC